MNNTEKFTNKADKYNLARPNYPVELLEYIKNTFMLNDKSIIADIGSGTGILTKQLLQNGYSVYAIEPNDNMRKIAESNLANFKNYHSINGSAENTGIASNSVEIITVAQAFHWFDTLKFKAECKRILKPNGKILIIWNSRDENSKENIDLYNVCKRYCPAFEGFSGGFEKNIQKLNQFFDNYTQVNFENPIYYTKQGFVNRALSSSYSLADIDKEYTIYLNKLENIFEKHQQNGILKSSITTKLFHN